MAPNRITVKLFVEDPESVQLDDFVPVFHSWIQKEIVEGLLLDVADYKHIQEGPGMILIGDQVDYALDFGRRRPGLLVRRKFRSPSGVSLQDQVHGALILALRACHALETDPALLGLITFRTGEVEIAFPDRFRIPNTSETFKEFENELVPILEGAFSREGLQLERVSSDPREAFAVRVHVPESPGLVPLIKQMESPAQPV